MKEGNKVRNKRIIELGYLLILGSVSVFADEDALKTGTLSPVTFTHGIASGDVTPSSAILWTRVDRRARLTVEVSPDPSFQEIALRRSVLASAKNDFTAKVRAGPLESEQSYFYRWRHGPSLGEVGTFKTAPPPWVSADLRFAYSGDSDGTKVNGMPFFNGFEALGFARDESLDFFVYLGDTVYPDSPLRPTPAETLHEYRDTYKVNREIAALSSLLKATSVYAIWDDHEVQNDYDGQTVDPGLYAMGREAFLEYMPLRKRRLLHDPHCAGHPLFRVFRWGKDADVIILDERSCRSADAEVACRFDPSDSGTFDPAPTLPSMLRVQFALPPSPPSGCLDAIFDPTRTMLGRRQKAALKKVLLHSQAKFKFILNEVPIQQFYAQPYDRWEGYGAERNEILRFILEHHLKNVIFLTTDTHANLINQVFIDQFTDPTPIAEEFVTGPVATRTLQEDILNASGPAGLEGFHALLNLTGVDCRHLNAFSYALVEVDASAGTTTVALKDDAGVLSDQQNPAIACIKTIGP